MKMRGIDFGNVLGASGVQGFLGEGYWFHKLFGVDFSGMTFVSKTATLLSRKGNMVLTEDYTPLHPFSSCIKVKLFRGAILNAVGLSNPGLGALLGTGKWQEITEPFFLSLMSLADTPQKRLEELRIMVDMLKFSKDDFAVSFGLQINLSCPNTGHDPRELIGETAHVLEIARVLGVPIMPKFSIASASVEAIMELNDNPHCDAICISNTIPFGWEGMDWERVWGSATSPLARFGGGGLSGMALGPLVREWIVRLRDRGFTKPICGGGGILSCEDVTHYYDSGVSSVFIGSVAALRPWRVKTIIDYANSLD